MEKCRVCKRVVVVLLLGLVLAILIGLVTCQIGKNSRQALAPAPAPVTNTAELDRLKGEINANSGLIELLRNQLNGVTGLNNSLQAKINGLEASSANFTKQEATWNTNKVALDTRIVELEGKLQKGITLVSLPTPVKQIPCQDLKDRNGWFRQTFPNTNVWGPGKFANGLIDVLPLSGFKTVLEKIPPPPTGSRNSSYVSWIDTYMGNGSYGLGYAGKDEDLYSIIILDDQNTTKVFGLRLSNDGKSWVIWEVTRDSIAKFAIIGNG